MKTRRMRTLTMLTLWISTATYAGDDHDHNHEAAVEPAPCGGMLRDAGSYKAEALIKGDTVKILIFDKNLKPVKLSQNQLVGRIRFPKQKEKPVILKYTEGKTSDQCSSHYEAIIPGIKKTHRYDFHVDLEVDGKRILADFGVDNIH